MGRCTSAFVAVVVSACGRVGFDPLGSWAYRKPLVIDHAQVAGDLGEFPVLVELDDPALAAHAAPDGHDLVFVDEAGQALAYELESYGASPPHAVAWVGLPDLSAEVDTVFYVYYGNPSALGQAQPAGVWKNAFVGVYHFGDGASLDVHDSTSVNDGTNVGAAPAATAIVGGGLAVTGGPAVSAPTAGIDESPGGLDTVTLWVNYTGPIGKSPVGFVRDGKAYDLWFQDTQCTGFNTEQGDVLGTTVDLTGRWVYLALVFYNGVPAAGQNALYVDGQPQMLTRCTTANPASYTVGGTVEWGGDPGFEMTGTLDEARIANVARPPAWIATEYANQSAPTTFVAAGPEESAP